MYDRVLHKSTIVYRMLFIRMQYFQLVYRSYILYFLIVLYTVFDETGNFLLFASMVGIKGTQVFM